MKGPAPDPFPCADPTYTITIPYKGGVLIKVASPKGAPETYIDLKGVLYTAGDLRLNRRKKK